MVFAPALMALDFPSLSPGTSVAGLTAEATPVSVPGSYCAALQLRARMTAGRGSHGACRCGAYIRASPTGAWLRSRSEDIRETAGPWVSWGLEVGAEA